MSCTTCRYWLRHNKTNVGECRVFAPVLAQIEWRAQGEVTGHWPTTISTDWCGEYQEMGERAMWKDGQRTDATARWLEGEE